MFFKKKDPIKKLRDEASLQRNIFLKEFPFHVRDHDQIVFFSHVNPDGDCIGCVQGLREVIKQAFPYKKLYVVGTNAGLFPWLTMEYDTLPEDFDPSKALAIILDVSTSPRIQLFNECFKTEKKWGATVVIDHHPTSPDFPTTVTWIDPTYSSSAAQLVQLCDYFCWDVSPKAATFFYLGLITDSGSFSFSSTLPRTMILAAKALRWGADLPLLTYGLTNRTFLQISATQFMLSSLVKADGFIWFHLKKADMKKYSITVEPALVNVFANIEDNGVWILFSDNEDGTIRVEIRSLFVSIAPLAVEFGGGGHINAAGCTLTSEAEIPVFVERTGVFIKKSLDEYIAEQEEKEKQAAALAETTKITTDAHLVSQKNSKSAEELITEAKKHTDKLPELEKEAEEKEKALAEKGSEKLEGEEKTAIATEDKKTKEGEAKKSTDTKKEALSNLKSSSESNKKVK